MFQVGDGGADADRRLCCAWVTGRLLKAVMMRCSEDWLSGWKQGGRVRFLCGCGPKSAVLGVLAAGVEELGKGNELRIECRSCTDGRV